jgi:hypothetical protein
MFASYPQKRLPRWFTFTSVCRFEPSPHPIHRLLIFERFPQASNFAFNRSQSFLNLTHRHLSTSAVRA